MAGAGVDPDPSFLKQPDYFRIFIQDFHYIDMCRGREHLHHNPKTGFFRIFCCEASEQERIRIQKFRSRIGSGSENSRIRSSLVLRSPLPCHLGSCCRTTSSNKPPPRAVTYCLSFRTVSFSRAGRVGYLQSLGIHAPRSDVCMIYDGIVLTLFTGAKKHIP